MAQDDGKHIRSNAEQLLQRVEKREQLLSLSPALRKTKEFLTPQQQEELRKQSIQHDKDERRSAEQGLRRHGYVPKIQRRRVVVDGKVYVEEIEGESDEDDCSFVSCLEEEGQITNSSCGPSGLNEDDCKEKEEWIHLPTSKDKYASDEMDDGDWVPLVPEQEKSAQCQKPMSDSTIDKSSVHLTEPAHQQNQNQTNQAITAEEVNPEIIKRNNLDDKREDNNPLLWIGGGLAVAGAVAGIAFANIKKKEHFEKKAKKSLFDG